MIESILDKLMMRVALTQDEYGGTPCWEWIGRRSENGYGIILYDGRNRRPHRLSYEYFFGRIVPGLEIDHICRNRACINPCHLEQVTHADNMRRSFNATKTHCVNGHEFTKENTIKRKKDGRRDCRTCRSEINRRYRMKRGCNV